VRRWYTLPVLGVLTTAVALAAATPSVAVPGDLAVPENAREARITVTLSEPQAEPFRLAWTTGSAAGLIADAPAALPGRDYVEAGGTLEFPPGETRREVAVTVLDDAVDDPSGFLAVWFGEQRPGPGRTVTLLRTLDDEPTPPASVSDLSVDEDAGEAVVLVTRPGVSLLGAAVYDWRTMAGTAGAGADFGARRSNMAIYYAKEAAEVRIPIADDRLAEPDERFQVQLAPATQLPSPWGWFPGPVADDVATVTIVDDDAAPVSMGVTPLRGIVRARGRRLTGATRIPAGSRVDARGGAARITFADGDIASWATIAGGAVRLRAPSVLALVSRRVTVRGQHGLRVRGRTVAARALSRARFTLAETKRGTRVQVHRGRVTARGTVLGAGDARVFGRR
jgi:hypothetical protein